MKSACLGQLKNFIKQANPPEKIETTAEVGLVKEGEGFRIPSIKLKTAVAIRNEPF